MMRQGSLVCVGTGMTLGKHMTPRCRSHIEQADIVFSSCHPVMQQWLETLNPNLCSLQHFYGADIDRRVTYTNMVNAMLDEVRDGAKVVGAFYGHPGVFAQVAHQAIELAKQGGYSASMEPGISAEDCLYADLLIDPGSHGCQHYEASQFLFYQRSIDNTAYLILWQIALAGDTSLCMRQSSVAQRQVLVEVLQQHYPPEHKVILYECATLPVDPPRIEQIRLQELATAVMSPITTLVVPPAHRLRPNREILARLQQLGQN